MRPPGWPVSRWGSSVSVSVPLTKRKSAGFPTEAENDSPATNSAAATVASSPNNVRYMRHAAYCSLPTANRPLRPDGPAGSLLGGDDLVAALALGAIQPLV